MRVLLTSLCVSLLMVACGGSSPEPKTAESEAAATKEEAKPAEPADEAADADAAEENKEEQASLTKTPEQVLTSENISFLFSFGDSDIKQAKEAECVKKVGDNPEKKAQCMSKAQAEVEADGVRLEKDEKDDGWWYIVFNISKGKPIDQHKYKVTFGEQTKDSIKLIPEGRDVGTKPGAVPKEISIKVPDAYSIVFDDPKKGKMVYKSKVGIIQKDAPK